MAQARSAGRTEGGILAPLRRRLFRAVWSANLTSNFGWLVQGVGAAWLMTSLDPRPDMVALVQTAIQAPILVLALIAGAAADVWARRNVLMVAQIWVFATSIVLAVLTWLGWMGPWLLLLLTFLLGAGAAINGPAMQAIVRDLVPSRDLPAAVTINAVAFNLARSVGPAIGGIVVALAGAATAFFLNAVSCIGLLAVLYRLRGHVRESELPRERVGSAMIAGLRYVGQTRRIQLTLLRSSIFSFGAASILALLPLVAREQLQGGPTLYGILLASFGLGALGGAFLIHPLRQRVGAENLVTLLSGVFGASAVVMGVWPNLPVVLIGLPLAGAAWLGSFSTFNIAVQLSTAFWVQARVLALYQMSASGPLAIGSWFWGAYARRVGIDDSMLASGIMLLASLALHFVARVPSGQAPDMRPAGTWTKPQTVLQVGHDEGPVLVLIDYRIREGDAPAFNDAMEEVGHLRRRDGAVHWQLYQDTTDPEHWVEAFSVNSWLDHLRQTQRLTAADAAVEAMALRYHSGDGPPLLRRLIHRELHQDEAGPAASGKSQNTRPLI
jgi:MFS family permease/quinol monooxygenase YgiN